MQPASIFVVEIALDVMSVRQMMDYDNRNNIHWKAKQTGVKMFKQPRKTKSKKLIALLLDVGGMKDFYINNLIYIIYI